MEETSAITYLLVFVSVVVPYLVGSVLMNTPKPERGFARAGLPPFYRVSWRFISAIANSTGPSFTLNHPEAARKFTKMAQMSGWPISAEHVYAARIFAASAGVAIMGLGVFVLSGNA